MSEKSLKRIGDEAEANYTNYTTARNKYEQDASDLEVAQSTAEAASKFADIWRTQLLTSTGEAAVEALERMKANERILENQKLKVTQGSKDTSESAEDEFQYRAEGSRHYRDNEAVLHDLAVIEAHLAGKAIKVEQPVVIGQTVPVHVNHA